MKEPKFKLIAREIEERITNGEYPSGCKLPTHRALAEELGTTAVTIAKVYQQLSDKGLIESHVGKGTFVLGSSHLNEVIIPSNNQEELNFSILQPCLDLNLYHLKKAMAEVSGNLCVKLCGYAEDSGHEEHRQAGAEWVRHYGLVDTSAANILLTDGAQHALSVLISALTNPGDTIAVEALTYPGIIALANLTHRHVVGVEMDEQGMSPCALESVICEHKPKLVIIVPSHQNPTGITMPLIRRQEIADVIERHQIWLAEDDIYSFLNTETILPVSYFIPERSFYILSLSKAISPAIRCGFMKVPEQMVSLVNAHIRTSIWIASPFNFEIAMSLIASGDAFEMAENQRKLALHRQAIAKQILTGLAYSASGYHIWLPLPSSWTPERFTMEAKNRNVIVSCGSYFDVEKNGVNFIRLSLMAIADESVLVRGLQILRDLIQSPMDVVFPF